jgi:hypothetical protein
MHGSQKHWAAIVQCLNGQLSFEIVYNVVLVRHERLPTSAKTVYGNIRNLVNQPDSQYRFGQNPLALVDAVDREPNHWGAWIKDRPATVEVFVAYINMAFQRALAGEPETMRSTASILIQIKADMFAKSLL